MWRRTCSSFSQPLLSPPLWRPTAGSSRCQMRCRKEHRRRWSRLLPRIPFSSPPGCADDPEKEKIHQRVCVCYRSSLSRESLTLKNLENVNDRTWFLERKDHLYIIYTTLLRGFCTLSQPQTTLIPTSLQVFFLH